MGSLFLSLSQTEKKKKRVDSWAREGHRATWMLWLENHAGMCCFNHPDPEHPTSGDFCLCSRTTTYFHDHIKVFATCSPNSWTSRIFLHTLQVLFLGDGMSPHITLPLLSYHSRLSEGTGSEPPPFLGSPQASDSGGSFRGSIPSRAVPGQLYQKYLERTPSPTQTSSHPPSWGPVFVFSGSCPSGLLGAAGSACLGRAVLEAWAEDHSRPGWAASQRLLGGEKHRQKRGPWPQRREPLLLCVSSSRLPWARPCSLPAVYCL